jgi:pimeloyl-ACP methyl ester carboxylesterase
MALASPLGLKVPEDPTTDLFTIAPAELGDYLTARPSLLTGLVPDSPTPDLLAEQYRELTSAVRLLWPGPYDRKLARWLHRIQLPTLLLWGTADRLIPVGQCAAWAKLIPSAESRLFEGAGHLLFDDSADAVEAVGGFTMAS